MSLSARCWRTRTQMMGAGLIAVWSLALPAAAQVAPASKSSPPPRDADVPGDFLVGPGYRRELVVQHQPISRAALAARLAEGKVAEVDQATGDLIVRTFVDHLPKNWLLERPADLPPGVRVDSLGNPIVNDTPGLPAWAQRDVDALRSSIAEWRDRAAAQRAAGVDTREAEGVLGNLVGQAITRSLRIDDLVNIDDPAVVTGAVASSIIGYLHHYENIRYMNQPLFRYVYTRTVYPARVADFVRAHGGDLDAVQALETDGLRGGTPSGCYTKTSFARGMTILSGSTTIWSATGDDDASADVPTGMDLFFFYDCQNPANNTSVRVSTNGFITFFQQGGGALNGTEYVNQPIPSTSDPDGFAAPWWDDLIVATNQGNTDRVSYKTEGAVDSRVFTVEWFSITRLGGSTDDYHFFQVKLYETTDVVELQFDLDNDWMPDTLDSATSGLETYSGAGGDCGPNCGNTNSTPPPNDYRFTPAPRPGNDACASAFDLSPGSSLVSGNLHRATADGDANCGSSSNNRDVWFTYTSTCAGTLHLNTCGSRDLGGSGNGIDTVISAHSGCPGTTANQLACNDDTGGVGCNGNDSAIDLAMTAGQTIYIRLTHFGDAAFRFASGAYQMAVSFSPTGAPANDNCANATLIANNATIAGDLSCATPDGSSGCGLTDGNNDIWYRFVATRPGTLLLEACGSRNNGGPSAGPDTVVSVHTGCPGTTANQIACNDDGNQTGCNGLDSRTTAVLLTAGTYRVRVTHYGDTLARIGNGETILHATYTCVADWNHNGLIQPDDVAGFVNTWFTSLNGGTLAGDLDGNFVVEPADVSVFVSLWFATLTAGGC